MSWQRCECMYVRCADGTRELYLQCDECSEKQREKKLKGRRRMSGYLWNITAIPAMCTATCPKCFCDLLQATNSGYSGMLSRKELEAEMECISFCPECEEPLKTEKECEV